MARVKICGITNLQDALYAIECGADALGFVFYEKSPRYIAPSQAKRIIDDLPPFVERVGLFVDEKAETINAVSKEAGISLAQIHFDADEALLDAIALKTLPVIRAKCKEDLDRYQNRYRLIDVYSDAFGGTGSRLDLSWFQNLDCSKMILAGGLTPENLAEAKGFGFYGVDVSSGVEAAKGKKDFNKVARFIANAKCI